MNSIYYVLVIAIVSGFVFGGCTDSNSSEPKEAITLTEIINDSTVSEENIKVYAAAGEYKSPAGQEFIDVRVKLNGENIDDLEISSDTKSDVSKRFQALFLDGVKKEIVGKKISELGSFGKINGSSLTGAGFNQAIGEIKKQVVEQL